MQNYFIVKTFKGFAGEGLLKPGKWNWKKDKCSYTIVTEDEGIETMYYF